MDVNQFRERAETNQVLADYLDDVAQKAAEPETARTVGVDLLFIVAAQALYLLVRNYLEHQRGLQQADLRRKMEQEIGDLVKSGYSTEQALASVIEVSKAITNNPPGDSILKAGLALLQAKR
jgi:hypothetical protein